MDGGHSRRRGRPENPIPAPLSPLGRLATALRNGRRRIDLSYTDLAERTRVCSPGTLQRAASGAVLPKHEVARAFAQACGLDVDEITQLWLAAYRGSPGGAHGPRQTAPQPHLVKDFPGLCNALEELRQLNGAPSYRTMEIRARTTGKELSRSTAYRICAQGQPPSSIECLEAFLVACEVPPRSRTAWIETWRQLRQHAALSRQQTDRRGEVEQLKAVVTDNARGEVPQDTAVRLLRKAGFGALERYRRFEAPWTVECLRCAATFRLRLCDVLLGRATCMDCPKLNDHVREAWAELQANHLDLLSTQQVRALRAAMMLRARLQHDHLEVLVFVADRKTGITLQSASWHPALEAVLRRHIRRAFRLDVLLVFDYDTISSPRNGQRPRRLAKDANLVKGPVESPPPEGKPAPIDGTATHETVTDNAAQSKPPCRQ
ncbi:helix-turn-helix domain-containing protein [Streptomyces sp. NPDC006285]|uniref:helix-turn-helix domain-containing protein n=1 Tax=Streptomyces sp. NPDC006285 TaxID=3364742 RepID=UPI0036918B95